MRKLAVWVMLGLFVWGLAAASQEGWIVWSSARAGDGKLKLRAIAPDGTKLVFNSDHGDEPKDDLDLWAMNVDGTGLVELVEALHSRFQRPVVPLTASGSCSPPRGGS
jgi:hypothetical protein